jgi:putative ABC transport system permease protein
MKTSELFLMAVQNLWARKSRTAFNIFGIVVSCSMLLLVFAGTRGAREGLLNLFEQSDFAKQVAIRQGRKKPTKDARPEELTESFTGVSPDRKERISQQLTEAWELKNLPVTRIDLKQLELMRSSDFLVSVLPTQSLPTQLEIDGQKIAARVACFSPETSGLKERIISGHTPQTHSAKGKIWLNEFRAWQLGYKTDEELKSLIGKKVTLRIQSASASLSPQMKRLAGLFGVRGINEVEQVADTFRKLFADADQTSLTELEQQAIREVAVRLGLDSKSFADSVINESINDRPPFVFREFEIAGVVKPPEKSVRDLFQLARTNSGSDLLINWQDFHAIEKATRPNRIYYYCVGTVTNTEGLRSAITELETTGFETRSAIEILDKADIELGKVRLVIAAIALVILLIATVGIMNTMIISVMERTPEFGIMKAVGAQNADIRKLMLFEAAFTGLLGAAVSLVVARGIDLVVSQFAKRYIETRIRQGFDFSVFVYSIGDAIIVVTISVAICMLASLLPSSRAAKLDPVEAMRR